jgi:segregation and condensation protein A
MVELTEENESLISDPEIYGLPTTLSCLGIDWNRLDISEFETYEPLGILVELAQAGKIDPWDIDVVKLTDNFLGRVAELKKMDLRISSRTLLYSAILLRMKSSGILGVENEDEEGDEFYSDFFDELDLPEPEAFPIPKLPVRRVSTRPVTLNELILELKKAENTLSKKNERKKSHQTAEEHQLLAGPQLTTGDVLGIAHEEAISSRLALIWAKLEEFFAIQPVVVFSSFLETSEDKIMDYLSLLFLASNRKIWLFQNKLFEELYIYPGEESGFSTESNPSIFSKMRLGLKDGLQPKDKFSYGIIVSSKADSEGEIYLDEKVDEELEKIFI